MSKRIIDLPTGSISPASLTLIGDPTSGSLSQVTYAAIRAFFQSTSSGQISGSGIDGFLPLWRGSQFLTSSIAIVSASNSLVVNGNLQATGSFILGSFSTSSQSTLFTSVGTAGGAGLVIVPRTGSIASQAQFEFNYTSGTPTFNIHRIGSSGQMALQFVQTNGVTLASISTNDGNGEVKHFASTGFFQTYYVNNVEVARLNTGGTLLLGVTSSFGSGSYRLVVSGSTFVNGNVSSSNYLAATQGIVVNPSGFAADGLTPVSGLPLITSVSNNATYNAGAGQGFSHNFQTNGLSRLLISDGTILVGNGTIQQPASQSTGTIILFNVSSSYVPITGSGTNFTALGITTNINQSTTGSGIMRGLHINSNVVNAIDYRALEISSGRSIFSGSVAVSGSVTASVSVAAPSSLMDFIGIATNNFRRLNAGSILMWADNTGTDGFTFQYQSSTVAAYVGGVNNFININPFFQPITGSATWNVLALNPNISQSIATGTTRGLFINPIITGSVDFRAIEVVTGKSIFNDQVIITGSLTGSSTSSSLNITSFWNTSGKPTMVFMNLISGSGSNLDTTAALVDIRQNNNIVFRVGYNSSQAIFSQQGLQLQSFGGTPGGIGLTGAAVVANNLGVGPTFSISVTSGTSGTVTQNLINLTAANIISLSGSISLANIGSTSFIPVVSSSAILNTLSLTPIIIAVSGSFTGFARGLYINPTIISSSDFRAIEIATGKTILGASSGSWASLNIPSGSSPITPKDGDIWYDGVSGSLKMQISGAIKTFTLA